MSTLTSSDRTTIAYEKSGTGPAVVVLVDGAMCYRASGPARPLAQRLAKDYTVYIYDRRGRGESGDTEPYSIEREVDDLAAVVKEAGGSAYAYGISSSTSSPTSSTPSRWPPGSHRKPTTRSAASPPGHVPNWTAPNLGERGLQPIIGGQPDPHGQSAVAGRLR
jgi:hypothetical protein